MQCEMKMNFTYFMKGERAKVEYATTHLERLLVPGIQRWQTFLFFFLAKFPSICFRLAALMRNCRRFTLLLLRCSSSSHELQGPGSKGCGEFVRLFSYAEDSKLARGVSENNRTGSCMLLSTPPSTRRHPGAQHSQPQLCLPICL